MSPGLDTCVILSFRSYNSAYSCVSFDDRDGLQQSENCGSFLHDVWSGSMCSCVVKPTAHSGWGQCLLALGCSLDSIFWDCGDTAGRVCSLQQATHKCSVRTRDHGGSVSIDRKLRSLNREGGTHSQVSHSRSQ